jgi:predicted nuclease with RNAse H fold
MKVRIIGVDCATEPKNRGFACAEFEDGECTLIHAEDGKKVSPPEKIKEWIAPGYAALIAIDAPLGWPIEFSKKLPVHRAAEPIDADPKRFFNRHTDRIVKEKFKTPLDIGADRIARTALSALKYMEALRRQIGENVPLPWDENIGNKVSAIEVYPVATLKSRNWRFEGYKKKDKRTEREEIAENLEEEMDFRIKSLERELMLEVEHVLDAVVCVLAGLDFLRRDVIRPVRGK